MLRDQLFTDFEQLASWDDFYSREHQNFAHDPADTGEEWFSDSDASTRMLRYLEDLATDRPDILDTDTSRFLDLGTGNAQLLLGVRETGFEGKLVGLDYSVPAVEFAREVVDRACEDQGWDRDGFELVQADFLNAREDKDKGDEKSRWLLSGEWDCVLDKGTLDAIALAHITYPSPLDASKELTGVQLYPRKVARMLAPTGVFLITSCNFTAEELERIMGREGLVVHGQVEYPTFEFGGKKGQTVCTLAFRHASAEA